MLLSTKACSGVASVRGGAQVLSSATNDRVKINKPQANAKAKARNALATTDQLDRAGPTLGWGSMLSAPVTSDQMRYDCGFISIAFWALASSIVFSRRTISICMGGALYA